MDFRICPIVPDDEGFLQEMLWEAANWRPGAPRAPIAEMMQYDPIARYVSGWGRPGDFGIVAVDDHGKSIGVAWWRLYPADGHAYGFIDEATPEVSIGVEPDARGKGIGTALLTALIAAAGRHAVPALNLSVAADNPAMRLYMRFGFQVVGAVGTSFTMRRKIDL